MPRHIEERDRQSKRVWKARMIAASTQCDCLTRLAQVGLTASGSSPGELDETVRADQAVNRELVKRIGLKLG